LALVKLFEKWGMQDILQARIVQAPPGIPVGALVARGEVALGFQQLSELMHLDGVTVVGTLPEAVAITTVFAAATCSASNQHETVAKLFAFMAPAEFDPVKQKNGMQSA
jgi:molybdate transport system substrate-binding protein